MRAAARARCAGPALLHLQPRSRADRDPRCPPGPAAARLLTQLIIVSGAPGTGKTSLATELSRALGVPVIHRDTIKEALFDTIGAKNREESHRLGRASYAVLYAVARKILESGTGLVLESNFVRGVSEAELGSLIERHAARLIHCDAAREVILQRIKSRPGRHPQHSDDVGELLEAMDAHRHDPLQLDVPLLIVNTDVGLVPPFDEIVAFCRRSLP